MEDLRLIYFSPTGTTQKIVREIGEHVELKLNSEDNITQHQAGFTSDIVADSLTIIGMPVYGGRLPVVAVETLKKLKSNQSPAIIIVVYGNRDYDDALLELKEIVTNSGFRVIGGAAFIGEHSFSSNDKPIAQNRPDEVDLIKCKEFAQMINTKLEDLSKKTTFSDIDVPGNFPYKERKPSPAMVHPRTDYDLCNLCGSCVEVCPTNAISINDSEIKTNESCIWCCACVKHCPNEARIFDNPVVDVFREKLFLNCSTRKEPVYFI